MLTSIRVCASSRAGKRDARLTENPSDAAALRRRTHRHLGELEGAGTVGHDGTGADHVVAEEGEVDHAAGINDGGLRIGEHGEVGGLEHEEALDPFAVEPGEVRSERWFVLDDADGFGHPTKLVRDRYEAQPSMRLPSKVTTALYGNDSPDMESVHGASVISREIQSPSARSRRAL